MSLVNVVLPPEDSVNINIYHTYTSSTSLALVYTWEAPFTGFLNMICQPYYVNAAPTQCVISSISGSGFNNSYRAYAASSVSIHGTATCKIAGLRLAAGTKLYIYAAHQAANSNAIRITGRFIRETMTYRYP